MNRDALFLQLILDAITRIEEYASVRSDRYQSEIHWQDAIIRQIEIVGGAAKRISSELRQQYPSIDWRALAAMRDILNSGVDLDLVWNVTQTALPALKADIETILDEEPELRLPPSRA